MKKFLVLLIGLLGLLSPTVAVADVAEAAIDTPWVAIGLPRVLHLELTVPAETHIEWTRDIRPQGFMALDYEDQTKHYMLEFGPDTKLAIDTLLHDGVVTYSQDLQFFAYDSAAMLIPPFRFVLNGSDTVRTQVLALKVEQPFETVPEDASAMQDLKSVIAPEFVLWDYVAGFGWGLLLLLLVIAAVFGYRYYKTHKSDAPVAEEKKEILPPHVVALAALDDLSAKKLWQQGQHKQFHTELTDILRNYIEDRYHVPALEKTSAEILEELVELTISQRSSYNNLKEVFEIADLVKFAKYEPLADENQLVYMNSRLFVEQTKETIVEHADDDSNQISDTNNQQ